MMTQMLFRFGNPPVFPAVGTAVSIPLSSEFAPVFADRGSSADRAFQHDRIEPGWPQCATPAASFPCAVHSEQSPDTPPVAYWRTQRTGVSPLLFNVFPATSRSLRPPVTSSLCMRWKFPGVENRANALGPQDLIIRVINQSVRWSSRQCADQLEGLVY
jgi:hypothetical protein